MPHLSIARLFEDNREKLKLEWLAGRGGGARSLSSDQIKNSSKGLIGHLNFIHPNLIQVVGPSEAKYLKSLDPARLPGDARRARELRPRLLRRGGHRFHPRGAG